VALNWGMGSSFLNAEVKEFDRLHIVLGWNSSCQRLVIRHGLLSLVIVRLSRMNL
jgi:hypothetical protein